MLIRFRDCTTEYECTIIFVDKNREFLIEFMIAELLRHQICAVTTCISPISASSYLRQY